MSRTVTETTFNDKIFVGGRKLILKLAIDELNYREDASGDMRKSNTFWDMDTDELKKFAAHLEEITA